jgi:hypothetical protein
MANKNQQISTKMQKAIPVILSEKTISKGCKKAGIDRATFYNWMNHSSFKEEFLNQSRQLLNFSIYELRYKIDASAKTLGKLLESKNENIRLKAACNIFDYVYKYFELIDLNSRVDKIEDILEKKEKNGHQ